MSRNKNIKSEAEYNSAADSGKKQQTKLQRNKVGNSKPQKPKSNNRYRGKQGRKDSKDPRINFDNARESRVEEDIKRDAKGRGCNDISWYNQNPQLLKSAGSLPFSTILGQDPVRQIQYPGIMVVHFNPSIGGGAVPYAINQAALSNYSFLVHANSRNYSQDPADYTLFQLAGIEVFAALSDLVRAYGITVSYNEENAYKPKYLLEALQFDPDDFIANRGQLWFSINELITRTHQIWIPNNMPYLERQYWLNSGVYTDAPGLRSQMYVFSRQQYFKLDETSIKTGTALVPAWYAQGVSIEESTTHDVNKPFMRRILEPDGEQQAPAYRHLYTAAEFISLINDMINALTRSQDRGQIMGNILNAYTASNIFAMNQIDVNYVVMPTFNAEVLTQIENVVPCRVNWPVGFFQDTQGNIRTQWRFAETDTGSSTVTVGDATAAKLPGSYTFTPDYKKVPDFIKYATGNDTTNLKVINFHTTEQPTPEMIMIATRLTSGGVQPRKLLQWGNETGGVMQMTTKVGIIPVTTGSELVMSVEMATLSVSNTNASGMKLGFTEICVSPDGDVTPGEFTNLQLMSFDWHPFVYLNTENPDNVTSDLYYNVYPYVLTYACGDSDNYSYVNDIELGKLNDVALYSEFGVYTFGV